MRPDSEGEIAVASVSEETDDDSVKEDYSESSESDGITCEQTTATESESDANKATEIDGMNVVAFSRKKAKAAAKTSS